VVRRTPHPDRGFAYEAQILECQACGHSTMRTVDAEGHPPEK
jgi:hypothetical protein